MDVLRHIDTSGHSTRRPNHACEPLQAGCLAADVGNESAGNAGQRRERKANREVRKSKRGSGAMDGEVMACIRDRSLTTRDSLL